MADAEKASTYGSRTILFVDEIHRFNKAQQDAFLPYVERGTIRLIGATTENPSFEIISALLSRCRVYTLHALTEEQILHCSTAPSPTKSAASARSISKPTRKHSNYSPATPAETRATPSTPSKSPQDSRKSATNNASPKKSQRKPCNTACCSTTSRASSTTTSSPRCTNACATPTPTPRSTGWAACSRPAKTPCTSPAASSAWPSKTSASPRPRHSTSASPPRTQWTSSAHPEGDLALAQAVVYLALAPKSNAVYTAYGEVLADIEHTRAEPVPLHLRNAPTGLMKTLDYGKGYQYAHDEEDRVADMECLPESLRSRTYYHPTNEGREKLLAQRMEEIRKIRANKRQKEY